MSDNNKKPIPEKLKQLQQLQKMMIQKQKSGIDTPQILPPDNTPRIAKILRKLTPKGILMSILQGMQNSVRFIDQFINFIIKKDSDKTNDVIKSARSPIMFGVFVLVFFVRKGGMTPKRGGWGWVGGVKTPPTGVMPMYDYTPKRLKIRR